MTDPVILYGTQSNGETLPVQVDATGRLVAEGLQGPEGPIGPPGPEGPPGELPSGAYDGAVLGWEDGEAQWVNAPGGLPQPLGSEGQIIQVVNGEAVWVSNPSVPPIGSYSVTFIQPPDGNTPALGIYDAIGNAPDLLVSWDTYQRMSSSWMTNSNAFEQGVVGKVDNQMSFKLNVQAQAGQILQMRLSGRSYCTQGKNNDWTISASCDNANLSPITPSTSWNTGGCPSWQTAAYTASFLINQANIGEVNVSVTMSGGRIGTGNGETLCLTGWQAIDAGQYLVQRMLEVRKQVDTADLVDQLLPEVIPTTDIDCSQEQ